jgi:hypothetical protein
MHRLLLVLVTVLIALAAFFFTQYSFGKKASEKSSQPDKKGFAVVELFTSEGCSSCPPADAAVARLLAQKQENVFILSFHVDYWNYLGWNDPFSQPQFSDRQRMYAAKFSLESIYTPQIVVNGKTEFVGSDETKLKTVVAGELGKEMASQLSIQTERRDNTVKLTYHTNEQDAVLNVALVQPDAIVSVKRGENSGRTLHHVNIVRAFRTTDASENGYLTFTILKELDNDTLQLIAFTQSKTNQQIRAAIQQKL